MGEIKQSKETKTELTVDISWIDSYIEKYFKNKLKKYLKEMWDEEIEYKLDFPDVSVIFPDVGERLEKLEDWKNDIDKGWVCINHCNCKVCTELRNKLKTGGSKK